MKMTTSRCKATRTLLSLGIAAGMLLVMPGCFLIFKNINVPWYIEEYGNLSVERRVMLFKEISASRACKLAPCHSCRCSASDKVECPALRECKGIISSLGHQRPHETERAKRERLHGVVTLFAFINEGSNDITSLYKAQLRRRCLGTVRFGSDDPADKIETVVEMMSLTDDPAFLSIAGDAIEQWKRADGSIAESGVDSRLGPLDASDVEPPSIAPDTLGDHADPPAR
jgi:hypothetical protein